MFSQFGTYKSLNKFSWRDTYIWFCQYNEEEEAALLCIFFKHIYVLLGAHTQSAADFTIKVRGVSVVPVPLDTLDVITALKRYGG